MLLDTITVVIMLIVAYAPMTEGLFTAFTMFCNVFLAGLIAFNFWEPIADPLDRMFSGTFLRGYEDALCLVLLFSVTLGLLRLFTNSLASTRVEFPPFLQRGGSFLFGLGAGYLLAGILVCVMQTLPWHENFMYYEPTLREQASPVVRVLPPDRVWLATLQRAGAFAFANRVDPFVEEVVTPYDRYVTFDKYSSYVYRYARFRRYCDVRGALPYQGEFDGEIQRRPMTPEEE